MLTKNIFFKLTFTALLILAASIFISPIVANIYHIIIFPVGLFFAARAFRNDQLKFSVSMASLVGFVIVAMVSVIANADDIAIPLNNLLPLRHFIIAVLAIWAFRYTFNKYLTGQQARMLINIFMWAASIASIAGIIGVIYDYNPIHMEAACHPTRSCGLYKDYISYGYGIGFFVLILTGFAIMHEDLKKYMNGKVLIFAILINFAGMIFSISRGSIITYLITFPFLFAKKSMALILLFFTIALVASSVIFFNSKTVQDMFLNEQRIETTQIRFAQWKASVKAFQESPWIGLGYGNFDKNAVRIKHENNINFADFEGHAHSNVMELLATTGGLGLLLILIFHLAWLVEMFLRGDIVGYLTMPFIFFLYISGTVQYTLGISETLFIIMLAYSLSQSIPKIEKASPWQRVH